MPPRASDLEGLGDRLEDWREDLDSVSGNDHIDWDKPEDWNKPSEWEKPEWETSKYTREYRDALSNFADCASSHLYYITPEFTVLHWLNVYGWRYVVWLLGNFNC